MKILSFILGVIVGLGIMTAHAALTTAQVSEHFGRAVRFALANEVLSYEGEKKLITGYAVISREWIPNGGFGTMADRAEGVRTVFREMFLAQTGMNATDGGIGQHKYKYHFLIEEAGLTAAEAQSIEPDL